MRLKQIYNYDYNLSLFDWISRILILLCGSVCSHSLIFPKENLTEVFGRRAIIIKDCDNTRPEHLQGGYVGRKDTECTGKRGDIHLFHTGLFEINL